MYQVEVSIIIPVYNAGKYLEKCIGSILNQSFYNFEIIIVNDGSTDNSSIICNNLAQKDNRIKVFHQDNHGVSAARNLGISSANGRYVMFLDADDYWLSTDCLKILMDKAIALDADLIRGEYIAVDAKGNKIFEQPTNKKKQSHAYKSIDVTTFINDVIQGEYFLFLSLFKYDKVKTLKFNVTQVFLEDMDFFAQFFLQPNLTCVYIPLKFYAYRKVTSSASFRQSIRNLKDSFEMCDRYDGYVARTTNEHLKYYFKYRSVMMYYWTLKTLSSDTYYINRHKIIKELSLKELHQRTCHRLWKYGIWNSSFIFIVLPIKAGSFSVHLKNRIIWYGHCARCRIKQILK